MPNHIRTNIVERIAQHLTSQVDGECWVTDYKSTTQGGHVRLRAEDWNAMVLLHRAVWEIHNAEPIPEGLIVRHTCDNPPCCNPEHLILGTHQDNTDDMYQRNRNNNVRGTDGRFIASSDCRE